MQRLEVSGAVRPIYGSLGGKRLISTENNMQCLGTKQKYTVLPGIPPPLTDGEYQSKQLYSPRKHTPVCQAPYAFNI